jgi:hypothetical protein
MGESKEMKVRRIKGNHSACWKLKHSLGRIHLEGRLKYLYFPSDLRLLRISLSGAII